MEQKIAETKDYLKVSVKECQMAEKMAEKMVKVREVIMDITKDSMRVIMKECDMDEKMVRIIGQMIFGMKDYLRVQ